MSPKYPLSLCLRQPQRGTSLFLALIALVGMSLAAIALVRSVDSGTLAIGNLAFKQAATVAADRGAETAIAWIQERMLGNTLFNNIADSGYYASSLDALDPSGKSTSTTRAIVDWDGDGCSYAASSTYSSCLTPSASSSVGAESVRYIITRLCRTVGDPNLSSNSCASPLSSGSSSQSLKRGELKYGEDKRFVVPPGPYYRIIARTRGARNTTSITETVVHF